MSKAFIPDIVCAISSIKVSYKSVLALQTRIKLNLLLHYLKKPYEKINMDDLAYKIGFLKGMLEKKEV